MSGGGVTIRACEGVEEFQACVALQKEVWDFADPDLIPVRMFVVASKIGGQVLGAFDGDVLVGFLLAIPGNRSGRVYLHSHMLAVREAYRNAGLGRRLKLAQREEALARGIELIEWTFDPLEIKNSFLNLVRLGAVARRYNVNQYGNSSSVLQGGLPTDRLIAEWWLRSERVQRVLRGEKPNVTVEHRIEVPAQIGAWKAAPATRDRAREVQMRNREQFQRHLGAGLTVVGYERDEQGNGTFLLGPWDENLSYES